MGKETANKWESRPALAAGARFGIFVAPILLSIIAVAIASQIVPRPHHIVTLVGWWVALTALSTGVVYIVDRLLRHLLPVVALFKLSLIFPDGAPPRFKTAIRRGTVKQLQRQLAAGELHPVTTQEAAEQLVVLASDMNKHDRLTRGHTERVRAYAAMIGEELKLDEDDLELLNWSGLVHDIGKLAVPPEILNSPDKPTDEEWMVLKQHPAHGDRLIEPLRGWLGPWAESATEHHERFDGTGYPKGLAGHEITLAGRIVAVADAYDVMTSVRSYKKAMPAALAREELARNAGTQFDPEIVRAFLNISIGRLRLVMGPLSSLSQLPVGGASLGGSVATGVSAGAAVATAGFVGMVAPAPSTIPPVEPVAVVFEASNVDVSGLEDEPIVINIGDETGLTIKTLTIIKPPVAGRAAVAGTSTVNYNPAPNKHGIDSMTYRACFDDGSCDDANLTVRIEPVNDDPEPSNDRITLREDDTATIDLLANDIDVDGDELTARPVSVSWPGHEANQLRTEMTDEGLVITPAPNLFGIASVIYEVTDTAGATATATLAVDVVSVNDAPSARDDAATTMADTARSVDVLANDEDVDGDGLVVTSITSTEGGMASTDGGQIDFTPSPGFTGPAGLLYSVSDGRGGVSLARLRIDVTPEPVPMSLTPDRVVTDEDTPIEVNVLANDNAGSETIDISSLKITRAPDVGAVRIEDTLITYTPASNWSGTESFSYSMCNTTGVCESASVTVTVNPVNDAPVSADDSATTGEEKSVSIDVFANDMDVDTPSSGWTATLTAPPTHGFALNLGNGTFNYFPATNYNGSDGFTYVLTDDHGAASPASKVSLSVTPVNDAPVAIGDSFSMLEDGSITTSSVTANDTDVDGIVDSSTVKVLSVPTDGTFTNHGNGTFTYVPTANWNGTASFTYTVKDNSGATSNAAIVTITVGAVNDAPVVSNDGGSGYTTFEGTPFTTSKVTSNDVDVDSPINPASISVVSTTATGSLVHNGDGTFNYTPAPLWNGSETFTYTVTDAGGLTSNVATVTISVTAVNNTPIAVDDGGAAFTTAEDTSFKTGDVTPNDSDVDHPVDPASVVIVGPPAVGSASNNFDGTFNYVPVPEWSGIDTFTYTITDAEGAVSNPATVTISVTPVNDAPVANPDSGPALTTTEDVPFTTPDLTANDTDVDHPVVASTLSIVSGPSLGTATHNGDGTVLYTPNLNAAGNDSFSYTITDAGGAVSNAATVIISITPVNDAPVANDDGTFTTNEDTPFTTPVITDNDTDVDSAIDPASITIVTDASSGSTTLNADGTIDYTPNLNYNGPDTITYTITDAAGATSNTATITITVSAVNDAPVANNDGAFSTNEDTPFITPVITDNDTDVDSAIDPASITIVTDASNGSTTLNADGTIDYTPNLNYNGNDTITYTITDAAGATSNVATVTITVDPVNDAPVANNDSGAAFTTDEDTPFTTAVITTNDTDVDSAIDPASVTIVTDATNGTTTLNADGTIDYTPNLNYNGNDTITYTITDAGGATSNTATITITVGGTNDPPVANNDGGPGYTTTEDTPFTTPDVTANDTDVDHPIDPASVTIITDATNGTTTLNADGTIDYTPNLNYNGNDTITYTITDAGGATSNTATITITVSAVNDAPVANNDGGAAFTTNEDTSFTTGDVTSNDTDVDHPVVNTTVAMVGGASNGIAINNGDGTFSYTPTSDFNGSDTITYTITDGSGAVSNTATITITVTAVNDAPVANDDDGASYTTDEDTPFTTPNVTGNDTDVDHPINPASVAIVADASNGSTTVNADGTIGYTPDDDWSGNDEITYTITDGDGATSNTGTITISVTAVNDAPVANDDDGASYTTDEDTPFTTPNVTGNDTDVDDPVDPASITIVADAPDGSTTVNPDGTIDYTPNLNYNGTDRITYTITDGNGAVSNTGKIDITVTPVNDAPVANDDGGAAFTTDEDTPFNSGDVTDNDSDVDSSIQKNTLTIVSGPTNGLATAKANGTFDYTPNASWSGVDTLTYTVADGDGAVSNTATVTITVNSVNDAPVANDDGGASFNTTEDTAFNTASILTNDTDSDSTLSAGDISIVSGPSDGTLTDNGDGTFNYDPDADYFGTDTFTYTIDDPEGATSNTATVTIVVAGVNDAPAVTNPGNQQAFIADPFSLAISATDVEGDGLSYGATGLPPGLSINGSGVISGTIGLGNEGTYAVDITVTDDGTPSENTVVSFDIVVSLYAKSSLAGDLVINEVLYSSAVVVVDEFIEIYNNGSAPIDISGMYFNDADEKTDGAEQLGTPFPASDYWGNTSTLQPGEYAHFWLAYNGVTLPPLTNPSSGLEYVVNSAGGKLDDLGDTVWLMEDGNNVIDYMAYLTGGGDTPIPASLGMWDASNQAVLLTGIGQSLSMTPNGQDLDTASCWEPTTSGNASGPCASSPVTVDTDGITMTSSVGVPNNSAPALVISEYSNYASFAGKDFIELYNASGSSIDIDGFILEIADDSVITHSVTLTGPATVIPPGGHYLVAESGATGADQTFGAALSENAIAIRVRDGSETVDMVGTRARNHSGGFDAALWMEGSGVPPMQASFNQSWERISGLGYGNCTDTNDNGRDFRHNFDTQVNPESSASPAEPCGSAPAPVAPAHLVISEYRTDGPLGPTDEFVEIFNPTSSPIDLGDYELRKTGGSVEYAYPSFTLNPGQHYLIAGGDYPGPYDDLYGGLGNGDGLELYNTVTATIVDDLEVDGPVPTMPRLEGRIDQSYAREHGGCQDTEPGPAWLADFVHTGYPTPRTSLDSVSPCP